MNNYRCDNNYLCLCFQSISAIIKPSVPDPGAFLLAHLRKDLQHLIRSLGKGTDDTVSTVHLLISSLLQPFQPQQCKEHHNNKLTVELSCACVFE